MMKKNKILAPIVLFVYNRPEHTKKTIEALQKNTLASESEVFVFSDGPKNEAERVRVNEVRSYIRTIDGFERVTLIEREQNLGLAKSVIRGVSQVVHEHGRVIVLEDDLVTSPYFLQFMNDGLDVYEQDDKVISIHGYVYPIETELPETFFLRGADCWGWATWKRGWELFESDSEKLLKELKAKRLTKQFDFGGGYPYTNMLRAQTLGFIDSWAIRWYASAFLHNKLTLYPGQSLVSNIGFDTDATHTKNHAHFKSMVHTYRIPVRHSDVQESVVARDIFKKYFCTPKLLWTTILIRINFYKKLLLNKYVK